MGPGSVFERELGDAEVVISQPFWPAYMTAERMEKAKKLKLIITAGIGSDHTDLQAAIAHKVTVAEVTFSNSISVSEHVVMMPSVARCCCWDPRRAPTAGLTPTAGSLSRSRSARSLACPWR